MFLSLVHILLSLIQTLEEIRNKSRQSPAESQLGCVVLGPGTKLPREVMGRICMGCKLGRLQGAAWRGAGAAEGAPGSEKKERKEWWDLRLWCLEDLSSENKVTFQKNPLTFTSKGVVMICGCWVL